MQLLAKQTKTVSTTGKLAGVSESLILLDEEGHKWIFKPKEGEYVSSWRLQPPYTCYLREVAAYKLDNVLEFKLVPPTKLLVHDERVGSAQRWLGGATFAKEVTEYFDEDIEMMGVFDFLVGQTDRHYGNFLTSKDGRPIAIDNGFSFSTAAGGDLTKSVILSPFTYLIQDRQINKKLWRELQQLSIVELQSMLADYLEYDAIEIFNQRFGYLINTGRVDWKEVRIIQSAKERKAENVRKMLRIVFTKGELLQQPMDIWEQIDSVIQKQGFRLEGKLPRGSKQVASELMNLLWKTYRDRLLAYLQGLTGDEPLYEISRMLDEHLDEWVNQVWLDTSGLANEFYGLGFMAGFGDVKAVIPIIDIQAVEWIKRHPNGILPTLKTFGEEAKGIFHKVIEDHFIFPEEEFSLRAFVKDFSKEVYGERWKFERIARTEASKIVNSGRLAAWEQDPDKYYFEYLWNATPDNRAKEISLIRLRGNPYSYDEIKFLWENQEQYIDGKWRPDWPNQRCTISRSPKDEEFQRNIFLGREHLFRGS